MLESQQNPFLINTVENTVVQFTVNELSNDLPSVTYMWISAIAVAAMAFMCAKSGLLAKNIRTRRNKNISPIEMEAATYKMFGLGFAVLSLAVIAFLGINTEITKEIFERKGTFYVLSLVLPSMLISGIMWFLKTKTIRRAQQVIYLNSDKPGDSLN